MKVQSLCKMADCSKAEKAQSPFHFRRVSCRLQTIAKNNMVGWKEIRDVLQTCRTDVWYYGTAFVKPYITIHALFLVALKRRQLTSNLTAAIKTALFLIRDGALRIMKEIYRESGSLSPTSHTLLQTFNA